jgi:hypothetical protein
MISLNIAVDNAGDLSTCSSFVEAAEWISEHAVDVRPAAVACRWPASTDKIRPNF